MINFTRAFDSAWERMMIILFRPFDPAKWMVIGLSAFLAGLLSGGNGGNSIPNPNGIRDIMNGNRSSFSYASTSTGNPDFKQIETQLTNSFSHASIALIVIISVIVFVVILALSVLIYWLGARGQFLLLDNLARNRGAITWPWQRYATEANRLFVFYLVLGLGSLLVMLPILGLGIYLTYLLYKHHRYPVGWEIGAWGFLILVYLAFAIVIGLGTFLFKELGVPLMFRNGLGIRAALLETVHLVKTHLGSIVVFVVLRIALVIALMILSGIACCVTCCIARLPYLGTVILLPAIVYIRCFTLDCLAQFGPQYDVWTVDVNPAPAVPPSIIPPRPLG